MFERDVVDTLFSSLYSCTTTFVILMWLPTEVFSLHKSLHKETLHEPDASFTLIVLTGVSSPLTLTDLSISSC